jgi:hypothetical protein
MRKQKATGTQPNVAIHTGHWPIMGELVISHLIKCLKEKVQPLGNIETHSKIQTEL